MVAAARERSRCARAGRAGFAAGFGLWLAWSTALGWTYPPPYGPAGPYGAPPAGAPGLPPGQYAQPGGQPAPWQFRPAQPDNSRGMPPARPTPPQGQTPYGVPGQVLRPAPGYPPGWPGGYAQHRARTQAASPPPRLEWSIDDTRPYVEQNLLLRLKLISSDALTTADPDLAGGDDVLMQEIAGPETSIRNGGDGRRELVTQFTLILTPLRPGNLELPHLEVTGTRPGTDGAAERYQAVATSPVRLQVRPAIAAVRPWLPLHSLTLAATIDQRERIEPGQPVTLALEVAAVGALAAQLPSLEDQLVSPDFRIYREQTLTDGGLSKDGRELTAKRTEFYTLVPQRGGTLRLPEIKVPWWSLQAGSRQIATLPIRTLIVQGGAGPFGLPAALTGLGPGWSKVWLPIAGLLLVLAGYWGGVLYHRRPPAAGPALKVRLRDWMRQAIGNLRNRVTRTLSSLAPAPLAARVSATALEFLPEASRLSICVRHANRARDPIDWCERFEQSTRRLLRAPAQRGIPNLTERILRLRPRADRARVAQLMSQLDAVRYGGQALDFPRWKRDLLRQVGRRPHLIGPRRPGTRGRRAALPELNPRPAQT